MNKQKVSLQLEQLETLFSSGNSHVTDSLDYKHQLFKCKNNFYGAVQRNILIARIKISERAHTLTELLGQQLINDEEKAWHRALKNKLNILNSDSGYLLNEGILTLYIELNDLREQAKVFGASEAAEEIVKCAIDAIQNLLKQYFALQEYQTRERGVREKENSIFSLRIIPNESSRGSERCEIQQKVMAEVEAFIGLKPLSELFELEMRKEERKMVEDVEICRICSQKIKLGSLQRHVYSCAKKSQLRVQLDFKNEEITALEGELKLKFQESCEELGHHQIDEEFRRICKLILHPERKVERSVHHRSSLIGIKSEKNINNRIESCILDFIDTFGQNSILKGLLALYKEREMVERGINNLQMNSIFSDQLQQISVFEKESDNIYKSRRTNIKKNTCYSITHNLSKFCQGNRSDHKLDKSQNLIPKRLQQSSSNRSSSLSKKSDKKQDDDDDNVMEIIQSRRSLSRKHAKQGDEDFQWNINSVKQYSSLHNIVPLQMPQIDEKSHIRLQSFQILKFLGQGAFGKVYMVRRKETKDIYALKIIKISQNYEEKQLQSIKNQHQIFKKIAGDHLVKAPFSFSQQSSHIFILQYMPGGDLRKALNDEVYFEEDKAKVYISQIILAIEHLHKYGIIHRDLKPQNLVIDRKGHLKLTDFGLSEFQVNKKLQKSRNCEKDAILQGKASKRKRRTALYGVNKQKMKLIGTPDYIAPQIINQTSFSNYTIDWWSLGVMAYQLVIGTRPFCGDTIEEVVDNITNFNIEWPQVGFQEGMISPQAKDFITQLLNKDFIHRLGANGADQIKAHPFLADIDWDNLKTTTPSFVPRKMTTIREMVNMGEDPLLRKEIEEFIKEGKQRSKAMKLKTFIRFDLLRSETIQNMEKKKELTSKKLKKLKTLKQITSQFQQNINPLPLDFQQL